jgi:exopolyphosphatase/guanosine-5'-triphosphate,3'-diphosphate pyrophosphatase
LILAAIDIGSNAARLLICEVVIKGKETEFNRLNIVRIPLQLGFDVFEKGFIGSRKKKMLIDTIKAYKQLMKVYEVEHYMACATSAMRDAQNSKEIIKEIEAETSIEIEIISGELEAEIIYENHIAELLDKEHSYLYMDVGGGSTELTLYHNNELVLQKSVNIGTVRMLTNKVTDETWEELKDICKNIAEKYNHVTGIGSGGNINKIFSLLRSKNEKYLHANAVKEMQKEILQLSVDERMKKYNIKKDRAEVIVPAIQIYMNLFKWCGIEQILVPKIGLADGLIQHLYDQVLKDA